MKRLLVAAFAALVMCGPAQAATRHDNFPLHPGSAGPRVADLQWLLGGHKPNVFTQVKPTFKHPPNGVFGARTKSAVNSYRYRIGYPGKGQCGSKVTMWAAPKVTRYLFAILEGKAKRPICWVGLAAKRVKLPAPGVTKAALDIGALEASQVGHAYEPSGNNRGPCISYTCSFGGHSYGPYQAVNGAWGLAWCATFQQWAFKYRAPGGTFAGGSGSTIVVAQWAQAHNFLSAKPKVGSVVIFLTHGGVLVDAFHAGFVTEVDASGYSTVEGNYNNGVYRVRHPYGQVAAVFVNVPGVA